MSDREIRLQKVIASAGLASRRSAEQLIAQGRVRVNGRVVHEQGVRVDPVQDRVEVDGELLGTAQEAATEVWALYKPKGYVTTMHDPQGRPSLQALHPPTRARLFPIGRLDYDAEGLLLLTNDGQLAQRVAHPRYDVRRIYLVKVKGLVTPDALDALREGPRLDGRQRKPVQARILHTVNDKTWLEVTLREGVHHHLKRLFGHLGHRVLKIKRYQVGPVALEDMRPGESRRLTPAEVEALWNEPLPQPRRRRHAGTPAETA